MFATWPVRRELNTYRRNDRLSPRKSIVDEPPLPRPPDFLESQTQNNWPLPSPKLNQILQTPLPTRCLCSKLTDLTLALLDTPNPAMFGHDNPDVRFPDKCVAAQPSNNNDSNTPQHQNTGRNEMDRKQRPRVKFRGERTNTWC